MRILNLGLEGRLFVFSLLLSVAFFVGGDRMVSGEGQLFSAL